MGVAFDGLVSIEYGGGNTGEAMAAAAHLGKYMVDADAAGRAVPELQFSTYYVMEQPITPFSVTTQYGDVVIVKKVDSDELVDIIIFSYQGVRMYSEIFPVDKKVSERIVNHIKRELLI